MKKIISLIILDSDVQNTEKILAGKAGDYIKLMRSLRKTPQKPKKNQKSSKPSTPRRTIDKNQKTAKWRIREKTPAANSRPKRNNSKVAKAVIQFLSDKENEWKSPTIFREPQHKSQIELGNSRISRKRKKIDDKETTFQPIFMEKTKEILFKDKEPVEKPKNKKKKSKPLKKKKGRKSEYHPRQKELVDENEENEKNELKNNKKNIEMEIEPAELLKWMDI